MKKRKRKKKKRNCIVIIFLEVIAVSILLLIIFKINVQEEKNTSIDLDEIIELDITKEEPPNANSVETIDYIKESGILELPVNGAGGYAAIEMNMYEEGSTDSGISGNLVTGQAFYVIEEVGEWWKVGTINGQTGWVLHKYCYINLPDVVPSVIYDNDNAYDSKLRSSGKEIPNITGKALYDSAYYNDRFSEEQYIVPVLYSMAPKICAAQQAAVRDGNTLIIYEGFRPFEVQQKIVANFKELIETDSEVKQGVETEQWSIGWFIATSVSNHQKGYAIDVSLGKILEMEEGICGNYKWLEIKAYEEYNMPTPMHELSIASVCMEEPVSPKSATAWKNVKPADTMNAEALLLQKYCTEAGMTPLASEWWHFNDLENAEEINEENVSGRFYLKGYLGTIP